MTFDVDEGGEEGESLLAALGITGPALVVRSGGGMAGQSFQPPEGKHADRPLAGVRRLPRRRHRLAAACRAAREGEAFTIRDLGQPERHVREPRAHRVGPSRGRRRGADRQVPTDVPPAMSTVATTRRAKEGSEPRLRTIGSVCEELREEFPDISVSKIRYLEDQGLIAPRRTRGGYRLFSPDDIERLTTILRLQRDEFLPLRVIREELAGPGASAERAKRRSVGVTGREDEIDLAELCERASASPDFVRAARGIRHRRLAHGGRRAPLPGERGRHRRRVRPARALRHRRPSPADVPDCSRPPGEPRRAARRARASARATRSGGRARSRTSSRSPASRRSSRTCSSCATCARRRSVRREPRPPRPHPRCPRLPDRGRDLQGPDAA